MTARKRCRLAGLWLPARRCEASRMENSRASSGTECDVFISCQSSLLGEQVQQPGCPPAGRGESSNNVFQPVPTELSGVERLLLDFDEGYKTLEVTVLFLVTVPLYLSFLLQIINALEHAVIHTSAFGLSEFNTVGFDCEYH